MKILLISSRFYPFKGGVENVIDQLYAKFSADHEVCLITTKVYSDTTVEDAKYKIKRIWLGAPTSLAGFIIFPLRYLKNLFSLISYTNKLKPDVINYHFPDDSVLYVYFLNIFNGNIPLIVNLHGNDLQIFAKKWYLRFFFKSILKRSRQIIVNSNYMKNELYNSKLGDFENKVSIIPNGFAINSDLLEKSNNFETLNFEYIFFVGRLVYKKGVDVLISAFSQMKNQNVKLIIEGKGEEMENLRELVSKYNLVQRVIFKGGTCSEPEKFFLIKNALFGVIPSRIEPFGIVALEYLFAKTPMIVSKTGGLVDILQNEVSAFFFENENVVDLANKMDLLYENGILRDKLTAQNDEILARYSWVNISNKYLECYSRAAHATQGADKKSL